MKVTKLRRGYRWHLSDGEHDIISILLPLGLVPLDTRENVRSFKEAHHLTRTGSLALARLIDQKGAVKVKEDRRDRPGVNRSHKVPATRRSKHAA